MFNVKTIALILVSLLGVWWGILTVWVIWCHRENARAPAKPLTPEELADCPLDGSIMQHRMRVKDYAIIGPFLLPFMVVMLPLYAYGWFLKRSHKSP